mmetsp:Transcript_90861/g.266018  ORF Transcript_90861/g.266018 Transcript_90861/m.266018 type:complete len:246 (+) Transcript_90861:609-1346(+)
MRIRVGVGREGYDAAGEQREAHAEHTPDKQRPAASAVNEEERAHGVAKEEGHVGDERGDEAVDAEAGEECPAIADHSIDTCDDLEELRQAANEHNIPEERVREDLAPRSAASLFLRLHLGLHHFQFPPSCELVARAQPCEHAQGLFMPSHAFEEARSVVKQTHAQCCAATQQDLHAQGPPPAVPGFRIVVVDHGCCHNGQADIALIDADHGPTDLGWSSLRYIGWACAGRDAHAHAGDYAASDQH